MPAFDVPGSFEAGRLFACACLGGLGQVGFTQQNFPGPESDPDSGFWLPAVEVTCQLPSYRLHGFAVCRLGG